MLTKALAFARHNPARALVAALAVLVSAYVVLGPLFAARYAPMTDLPFHATQSATFRHYLDPSFHLREQFELHPIEVPYMSMYAIGALFMVFLPAATAVKLAAAAMLGLLPAGLAVLAHGMRRTPLLGLLGLGLVWCTLAHWGFLNYLGAVGLFAMAVGLSLLVVRKPTRERRVALAIVLVAVFFTHIFRFPFTICGVIGAAILVYPSTRRIRPLLLPLLPALALFAYWLWVRPRSLEGSLGPLTIHRERFGELPDLLMQGFRDRAEPQSFRRFFTFAVAAGAVAVLYRVVVGKPPVSSKERLFQIGAALVPLGCAGAFLLMFLVLPMEMGLWWYVYPREATAAAFMALGAFPDLPKPLWLKATLAGLIAFGAVGIARVALRHYATFDAQTRDFDRITERIPKAPKLLYLIFDHSGSKRQTTPFLHLPAYVQAEKGGWLSFHFASWGASPLRYRSEDDPEAVVPPPVPTRWEWTPTAFAVKRHGPFFDWFLVRSRTPPDTLFAPDPSIERVDHAGSFWLYKRRSKGSHRGRRGR